MGDGCAGGSAAGHGAVGGADATAPGSTTFLGSGPPSSVPSRRTTSTWPFDAGGAFLTTGVALLIAVMWPRRQLATMALVTYLTFSIPHAVYHAAHEAPGLSSAGDAANVMVLFVGVVMAAGLLSGARGGLRLHAVGIGDVQPDAHPLNTGPRPVTALFASPSEHPGHDTNDVLTRHRRVVASFGRAVRVATAADGALERWGGLRRWQIRWPNVTRGRSSFVCPQVAAFGHDGRCGERLEDVTMRVANLVVSVSGWWASPSPWRWRGGGAGCRSSPLVGVRPVGPAPWLTRCARWARSCRRASSPDCSCWGSVAGW